MRNRDPHSFPTRRSSDLAAAKSNRASETSSKLLRSRDCFFGSRRSEEHTSELQSRFDLVCRLLLEKKKQSEDRRVRLADRVALIRDYRRSDSLPTLCAIF